MSAKKRQDKIKRQLERMNKTGNPEEIILRKEDPDVYHCVPFDPHNPEEWPLFEEGWFLVKRKNRYRMIRLRKTADDPLTIHRIRFGTSYVMGEVPVSQICAKIQLPFGNKFRHIEREEWDGVL